MADRPTAVTGIAKEFQWSLKLIPDHSFFLRANAAISPDGKAGRRRQSLVPPRTRVPSGRVGRALRTMASAMVVTSTKRHKEKRKRPYLPACRPATDRLTDWLQRTRAENICQQGTISIFPGILLAAVNRVSFVGNGCCSLPRPLSTRSTYEERREK